MRPNVTPGTRVADRFTIVRFLAEGGMGEVYEANDEVLGEAVALKFLSYRSLGDEHIIRRFRREIQLARKVTHPNVCRLFDIFQHDLDGKGLAGSQATFVTMELLRGETLEKLLEREAPLDEAQARPIVIQMCSALAAAHAAGVIHRDFKSNNVMLETTDGVLRTVVTDFGLARSMLPSDPHRTPLTANELILGTADYMSPEQLSGDPVTPASDVYSLGVVMFEMLTGKRPYSADNPMQLLVQRVSNPPSRPRDHRPEISDLWDALIMRCLAEEPKERPTSVLDIVRQLEVTEVLDSPASIDPLVPASVPASSTSRWARPGAWVALLVAALALFALFSSERSQAPATSRELPKIFSPLRMTTGPGLEIDPALSPDGERMIYTAEGNDGQFALYVQALDASAPPQRLDTGGQAFEPTWSPDGRQIAFHSPDRGGIWRLPAPGSGHSETSSTASATDDGLEPVQLTRFGSRPAWSPDGKSLAFQTIGSPLISDNVAPALAPSVISILDLASGEVRTLTRPGQPAGGHGDPGWSPDGRFVVFSVSGRADSEVWTVPAAGGEAQRIVGSAMSAFDPVVSRDGRNILFTARVREVNALWQVPVDPASMQPTGEPRQIAGLGVSSIRQGHLSSDGNRLLFSAFNTRSNLLALRPTDDGAIDTTREPVALTRGDDRNNRPAIDASGQWLAFDHWKVGVDVDIFVLDLASGEQQQVTTADGTNSHASWTPDGTALVYSSSQQAGLHEIKRIDLASSEESMLVDFADPIDWAVLSPSGDYLAYHARTGGSSLDVWLRDLQRQTSFQLTRHGDPAGFPCWSHDGKRLAYQVRQGDDTHTWLVDVATGDSRQLTNEAGHSWPYSFSPDNRSVAFSAQRDGVWNLWAVDIDSGALRQLTSYDGVSGYVRYPAWSPTGDLLVYERSTTSSDIFLVEDFL